VTVHLLIQSGLEVIQSYRYCQTKCDTNHVDCLLPICLQEKCQFIWHC